MLDPTTHAGMALSPVVRLGDPLVDADAPALVGLGALGCAVEALGHLGYTFCNAGVPRMPVGRTNITAIRIPNTTSEDQLPFR